jgi:hypothetical protein
MGKSNRTSVSFYNTNATCYNSKLWVSPRDTTQKLNFHNFTTWNNSSNYSRSFLQRKKSWETALKCWPREKNPNPNLTIGAGICLDVWTGVCPIKISIKWQPVLWPLSSSLGHPIPQFAGIKAHHAERPSVQKWGWASGNFDHGLFF